MGMARCPSCSQNAHDKNVLVQCAQERAALAVPPQQTFGSEEAMEPDHLLCSRNAWPQKV